MIDENVFSSFYNYFYRKFTNNRGFVLDYSLQNQKKLTQNFLKKIDEIYLLESVGEYFLYKFLLFQFWYWDDKKTARGLSLSWVIGKKAVERWINRKNDGFLVSEIKYELNFNEISSKKINKSNKLAVKYVQDLERKRFYNTEKGFANCLDSFVFFDDKNKLCLFCQHKVFCKKISQTNKV